jgi:nucleotide-binding universal stress UspA family protein
MSARSVVVVGHDPHRAARAALDAAVSLARDLDAELHVVHSATLDDCGADPDTEQYEAIRDRVLATERGEVSRLLDDSELDWSYHEEHGDPVRALTQLADAVGARCIVVGATHPRVLRHLFGGESVGARLLRCQRRPVLVVPEPAD